jgi:hypothetical protein
MKTNLAAESGMIVMKNERDFFSYIENRMREQGFEVVDIARSCPGTGGSGGLRGSRQKDRDCHG